MRTSLRRARQLVFGLAVAGALGFGGSQALAAPVAARVICEEGQIDVGTCPSRNCGNLCAGGFGVCTNGCCACKL